MYVETSWGSFDISSWTLEMIDLVEVRAVIPSLTILYSKVFDFDKLLLGGWQWRPESTFPVILHVTATALQPSFAREVHIQFFLEKK